LGTSANFNGFGVLAVLLHGSQLVSVSQTLQREQKAPPMFGRATITLGIGPHSSSISYSAAAAERAVVKKLHGSRTVVPLVKFFVGYCSFIR